MIKAYSADTIFTGDTIEKNCAVIIENNFIKELSPIKNLPAHISVIQHVPMIAPAFIDIQVYGASSKLFSVYPSPDTLQKIKEYWINLQGRSITSILFIKWIVYP